MKVTNPCFLVAFYWWLRDKREKKSSSLSCWSCTRSSSTWCYRSFEALLRSTQHIDTISYDTSAGVWCTAWYCIELFTEIILCQVLKVTCFKLRYNISQNGHVPLVLYLFNDLNRGICFSCWDYAWFRRWIQHAFSNLGSGRTCIDKD